MLVMRPQHYLFQNKTLSKSGKIRNVLNHMTLMIKGQWWFEIEQNHANEK